MHTATQLALKEIHSNWLPLFQSISCNMVDLLDETILKVIQTGQKSCPDHPSKILKCLSVNPDDVKVCLMGQDVYPQPGISTGYAFGCNDKWQPSLNIIVRELGIELGDDSIVERFDGTLKPWVDQGVLLLNSSLTCEQWKPNSHYQIWNPFMIQLLKILNDLKITRESMNSIVFVFLGKTAQGYSNLINDSIHYKINRNHPAAETHGSAKFEGFFNETNKYLSQENIDVIQW
jgi:uracil-DNA glycosylase